MITLKPTFRYWLMKNSLQLLIFTLLLIVAFFWRQSNYIMWGLGLLALILLFTVMWDFVVLYNIIYIIDIEQIIIKRGVFRRTTNYMEMYRIYDYQKKRHFIEAALGLMNIVLLSRDVSNPSIIFVGIPNNDAVIPVIRSRVEAEKQKKRILEFNNPYIG